MPDKVGVLIIEDNEHLAGVYASIFWDMNLDPQICQHLNCAKESLLKLLEDHNKLVVVLDGMFPDTQETLESESGLSKTNEKWNNNWLLCIEAIAEVLEDTSKKVLILANSSNSKHNKVIVTATNSNALGYNSDLEAGISNKDKKLIQKETESFINN